MKPNDRDKRRYDIYIADAHRDGDKWSTIEGSADLSYEEMTDWLMHGGDWLFQVVPHTMPPTPENIIMRGVTYGEVCEHNWYVDKGGDGKRWELCTKCDVRRSVR